MLEQRLWAAPAPPTLSAQSCCGAFDFSFHNWVKLWSFSVKSSSPVSQSALRFFMALFLRRNECFVSGDSHFQQGVTGPSLVPSPLLPFSRCVSDTHPHQPLSSLLLFCRSRALLEYPGTDLLCLGCRISHQPRIKKPPNSFKPASKSSPPTLAAILIRLRKVFEKRLHSAHCYSTANT